MKELQCLSAFIDEANEQLATDANRFRAELSTEVYGKIDTYMGSEVIQKGISVKEAETYFAWLISPLSTMLVKAI